MPTPSDKKKPKLRGASVSRRDFLRVSGAVLAGGLLAGCAPNLPPAPAPAWATATPGGPRPLVALAQAESYERKLIRRQVESLLDALGGVKDIVSRGDKVVIKANLTGGTGATPRGGEPAAESHVSHPELVRALGELLREAGARELYIVESVWDPQSFHFWGYDEIARPLDARLVDLNQAAPYPDFARVPVGSDWFIYEALLLNRLLQEADAFVSVAKLKCHCSAGVTLSMKNLVGIAPVKLYKKNSQDGNRSAFHGSETGRNTRLPRIIVDLNRARPIHLALLDGVATIEGGEGPWNTYTRQVKPGVLLAGKNALATDAIGTSLMGFDPTSEAPDEPFLQSDNYLNLASQRGLGSNRPADIDTAGADPAGLRYPFAACTEW